MSVDRVSSLYKAQRLQLLMQPSHQQLTRLQASRAQGGGLGVVLAVLLAAVHGLSQHPTCRSKQSGVWSC